jgi:hypothetical protein
MASKLVKLPEDLYTQAVAIAREKSISIGEALRFINSPESNVNEPKKVMVNPKKIATESVEKHRSETKGFSLDTVPILPVPIQVNGSLEQRVGNLEQETLVNRQLSIINARQHARALLSQVGQKPVTAEQQLELFMSELASIGVPESVLEASQAVLEENGYKTLEMQPLNKPKALLSGGN